MTDERGTFGTNEGDGEFEIFVEKFGLHMVGAEEREQEDFLRQTAMHFEPHFPSGNA